MISARAKQRTIAEAIAITALVLRLIPISIVLVQFYFGDVALHHKASVRELAGLGLGLGFRLGLVDGRVFNSECGLKQHGVSVSVSVREGQEQRRELLLLSRHCER